MQAPGGERGYILLGVGRLPSFSYLFILAPHCFVNTPEVGVSPPQPPSQPPSFPKGEGSRETETVHKQRKPEKLKRRSIHGDGTRSREKQAINSLRSSVISQDLSHPPQAQGELAKDRLRTREERWLVRLKLMNALGSWGEMGTSPQHELVS